MYKMIAIDLDDTLMNDHFEITRENKEALNRAKFAGVRLCMVTGRNYTGAKFFLQEAGFQDLMSCVNGAYIVDPQTDKILNQFTIPGPVCSGILEDIESMGIHVNLYHEHRAVSSEQNRYTDYYRDLTGVALEPVGKLSDYAIKVSVGKLLLMDEPEKLKEIQKVLRIKYRDIIGLTFSKPNHLEVNSIFASKGAAVKTIAEFYGIAREEIIAIGNDENDVSMLQYAGLGAAMGNSPESVKKEADIVTRTNNENGVAHIINTYL